MLVHGNDWFVIPYDMPIGHLGRIDSLVIRDVFGGDTLVERADRVPLPELQRWTLFGLRAEGRPTGDRRNKSRFSDFRGLRPPCRGLATHTSATDRSTGRPACRAR